MWAVMSALYAVHIFSAYACLLGLCQDSALETQLFVSFNRRTDCNSK